MRTNSKNERVKRRKEKALIFEAVENFSFATASVV
jgi:hypothetical protein